MEARALLERLLVGEDLTQDQAGHLMEALIDPEVADVVKAGLLVALRAKGETAEEVRGMALAMRRAAHPLPGVQDDVVVDTCGTGGDGSHSFNVSTATALLCAAGGLSVVKHGNRSVSSQCGSADVLEALGIPLPPDPSAAAAVLDAHGFTFLFAPVFHPAMKAVVPVRRGLRVRTVFNVLGPLTNPASPQHQLVGAFSEDAAVLMAETLSGLPIERAFVVHGTPSWDEATPVGPFLLLDVTPGQVERRTVDPGQYGVPRCAPEDLAGGDAPHNADMLRAVFAGERGPVRDAVVLNTALVLQLTGRASDPQEAAGLAASVIDDGRARRYLDRLVETSA
jgi:anthranilate phosphoribosyltransferase